MSDEAKLALSEAKGIITDNKDAFATVIKWLLSLWGHIEEIEWEDISEEIAEVLGDQFEKYAPVLESFWDLLKYVGSSYTDDDKFDFGEILGIVRRAMSLINAIRKML